MFLPDTEPRDCVVGKEDRSVAPAFSGSRDGIKSLLEPSIAQRERLMTRQLWLVSVFEEAPLQFLSSTWMHRPGRHLRYCQSVTGDKLQIQLAYAHL